LHIHIVMSFNKKILFVDNFKLDFDNPMSTLYINKCKKICEAPNVIKVDITDKKSVDEVLNLANFDTILLGQRCPEFYKANKHFAKIIRLNLTELLQKSSDTKRFMLLQDTHPKTYGSLDILTKFINEEKLDLIFTFYENSESRYIKKACADRRFFHLPHHIDTKIFNPPEDKIIQRPYDIILYGDIHPTHYPFRKRLFELILKEAEQYKLSVLYVTPPVDISGKTKVFDPDKCEAGLASKIRSAKYAIATKSKYDYLVAKYLEIAACETTVIGDMATDGISLPEFGDNYIKVNNKMTDKEIMDTISDAVKTYNVNPISKNRLNFAQYILSNYNLDKYQEKLLYLLKQ